MKFYLISGVGSAAAFAGALLLRRGGETPFAVCTAFGGSSPWRRPGMQVANAPLSRSLKINEGGAI